MHFNTIVIGKGLVGSAVAKYLSAADKSIAIIGPNEPENYNEALVFASHYDQARVQRIIGKDDAWTKLNLDSVQEYKNLETLSSISFHNGVGCLYVKPNGPDEYLHNADSIAKAFNLNYTYYSSGSELSNAFSTYNFPAQSHGLYEQSPAGLINPRLLLQAQLKITEQQHGTIINDTVLDVIKTDIGFEIKTKTEIYTADKVLVAAGSFINYLNLLPQKLALSTKSETILLAQVSQQTAIDLNLLPSLLYEIENHELDGIYLIKPLQYEDGNYYIKMGCNIPEDIYFKTISEAQNWFLKGENNLYAERLLYALKLILPGVKVESYHTRNCIISRTPHGRPYIGQTNTPGLYVAGGCNGYSAMCSNAIGQVAASLVLQNTMPPGYHQNSFEILYT
jgi:glycine/D-amino acid oxidase-like deaminating enzyme